jgi:FkbM family methyltransferase
MDDAMRNLVEPLGAACRDALEVEPSPRTLKGWELKPFSVIHSSFREVLYLDADNVPLRDPSVLFDCPAYQEHGAAFWPDLARADGANWIADLTWEVAGIDWREGPAFESGQFLIDKSRCWKELQVAMHLNEYSDFWYRYVYGDKDTFKLAWHRLGRRYAMPETPAGWDWPAIRQHDFDGNVIFAHACQGKDLLRDGSPIRSIPHTDLVAGAARDLQSRWRGEVVDLESSRTALERSSRARAGLLPLADGQTVCTVLGRHTLYCEPAGRGLTPCLSRDGYWESGVTLFIQRLVQRGWHCVDVGANCGYYTLLLAARCGPRGRVLAVEPNRELVFLLQQSLAANQLQAEVVPVGVAKAQGEMTLHVPLRMSGDGTLRPHLAAMITGETRRESVPTVSLDELLADWPTVDFVKLDIEGAEELMWDGAQATWRRPGIHVVMEFCPRFLQDAECFLRCVAERFPLRWIDAEGDVHSATVEELLYRRESFSMLFLSRDDAAETNGSRR